MINGYPIIDNCNKAITAIRSGDALGKYASDPSFAAARLSEVLFNRAYVYYLLNTVLVMSIFQRKVVLLCLQIINIRVLLHLSCSRN